MVEVLCCSVSLDQFQCSMFGVRAWGVGEALFRAGDFVVCFWPLLLRVPKAKGFPEHMGSSLHWVPF